MVKIIPKSKLAKLAIFLIGAMPVLFTIGSLMANSIYKSVPAGDTILLDIMARPALAITMIAGMICGISAFVIGVFAFFKRKERAILIYIPIVVGGFLILFLFGEILFPH
jgi:hypothetical protein